MTTGRSSLTENYNSWTEADRRSTRWLAAIVGGAGIFILDAVGVIEHAVSGPNRQTSIIVLFVVLAGTAIALTSGFKAESDADADISHWLSDEATSETLAKAVARKQLLASNLPYSVYGEALKKGQPAYIANLAGLEGIESATEEQIKSGLRTLLEVQNKLRWAATHAEDRDRAKLGRAADRIEHAVDELRARANFQATRNRMTDSKKGIVAGAALSLAALSVFVVTAAEASDDSSDEASTEGLGNNGDASAPIPVYLYVGPQDREAIESARGADDQDLDALCVPAPGLPLEASLVDGTWVDPVVVVHGIRGLDQGLLCPPVRLLVVDSSSIIEPRD
jgi:hypothetical protein